MDGYNYDPYYRGASPPPPSGASPPANPGLGYNSSNNSAYPPPAHGYQQPNYYPPYPYTTPPPPPPPSTYPYSSFPSQPSLQQQHDSFNSSPYGAPMPYSNPPIENVFANVRISQHATPAPSFSASQYAAHNTSIGGGSQQVQSMQISQSQSGKTSLKVLLLHGNLDVWVLEARNLPNMDGFSKTLGGVFGSNSQMTSDSYVTFSVANAVLGRTYVISNSVNPDWHQHFYVPVAHQAAVVKFLVKDSDVVGSELMGTVEIPAEQLATGVKVEGVYPVLNASGKPCNRGATLKLSIHYTPINQLNVYHQGVVIGPDCIGVPGTYFPLRKGGRVTLYQDAHVPDGCLPQVMLENGTPYVHGKCWVDIVKAIGEARRFIYITGWSVYHNVQLVRDAHGMDSTFLGDLLKSKSQEGVRVLLLVWDDPTSTSVLGFKKEGIMSTHDEETRRFFKNTSVNVLLCPRSTGKRHGFVKQQETGLIYTHHQKTVILDSDAGNNKRKVVAFVGGLDLCDGRYDTPSHPIFRTLQTVHKNDCHNPTFTGPNIGGPREPWHDLHTKIDGPAAYDVLQNFEERWLRASKPQGVKKMMASDDSLLKIERVPDILKADELLYSNDNDPETWHVQIFRSIDSNSVKGFPKDPKIASSKNLVCGKNILVDMSIHTAYVKAIRAAQHFIYIENQYFLGSSFSWNSYKELGANNLIPMEIALKIASKIRASESFSVYIVIPMWPEGIPTDIAIQRILLWQNKTMEMMYETIYKALVDVGREKEYTPQDYLNFFCLGNREAPDTNSTSRKKSTPNTPSALAEKNRRFMIYVHSKGMIVDDEYLIVGSANINQRSLEGTRDTEIAMGSYQPNYTWARKRSYPRGQIHAYRMSLWAEHTGVIEECFYKPDSVDCMRRVRAMGQWNWDQFVSNEITEMKGHLMKYPVHVNEKGKVTPLPGFSTFPDVGGNICGSTGAKFIPIQENLTI